MKTREFLSLILPATGIKYLADLRTFEKRDDATGKTQTIQYFKHYPHDNIGSMAGAALDLDAEGMTVYFAMAGFSEPVQAIDRKTGEPRVVNGKPKMDLRTQPLVQAVKCLWADIDCSPEKAAKGEGYASKAEAAKALSAFCKATGTPAPLIVDSGGGLHCYWPFSNEVRGDQWLSIARMWRSVTQHFKLRSDPSRDIDSASVLRPVGTHNRKQEDNPRRVSALTDPAKLTVWSPGTWVSHITRLMKQHDLALVKPAQRAAGPSINDDLATTEYPPAYAVEVARKCTQMLTFYNARGDVSEPVWRAALGILKHTEEGDAIAHEWSAGHPEYDEAQTQEKLDRWTAGPTSCAHFERHAPELCQGCAFRGKITSPIALGVRAPEVEETVEVPAAPTKPEAPVSEGLKFELPLGFTVQNGQLCKFVTDAEGVTKAVPLLSTPLFVTDRVWDTSTGTYTIRCAVLKVGGAVKQFTMQTSVAHSSKLAETLAGYEVFVMPKAVDHVRDYIRASITKLAETVDEQHSIDTYGWRGDLSGFVLGDVMYAKDGTDTPIVATGNAHVKLDAFSRAGTANGWAEAVNALYNRPGMQPMQYALCSGLGSILSPFVPSNTYHGCLLALTSAESGLGKSTVALMSLYAFGDAHKMKINGERGATTNALYAEMGTFNNVPLLFDEFSQVDQKVISSLAYDISGGQERIRLKATGELRPQRVWDMSPFITANTNLSRLLSYDGANAEAQALRMFEISLDAVPLVKLQVEEMKAIERQVYENRGTAGPEFIRFVVQNQSRVEAFVGAWFDRLTNESATLADQKYRFFRGHVACTLAAAEIMALLGLVSFSLDKLFYWAKSHCESLAADIRENNTSTPDEALNRLVSAFSQQTIVTYGYGDNRCGSGEDPLRPLHGEPVARHILGTDKLPRGMRNVLAVSRPALKKWCVDQRVDFNSLIKNGMGRGTIKSAEDVLGVADDRFALGKGTTVPAGRLRCVFIDMGVLAGVPALRAVQGGDLSAASGE